MPVFLRLGRGVIWTLVVLGGLAMLIPFLWMVSTSLKTDAGAFEWPPKVLDWPPQWHNWPDAWKIAPFARFFFNSTVVSVTVTVGSLLLNSIAAFGFSKFEFRGRNVLFLCLLATLMIPY